MFRSVVTAVLLLFIATSATPAAEYYTKHKGDKRRGELTTEIALVYVFRPATVGAAVKTWTFVDDQLIGLSKSKGYYFAQVPEGKHLFWAKAENVSAFELEVDAGSTYYLKTAIRAGFGKARVKLTQIDEAEAEKYFEKCSYCEPTEGGKVRSKEIVATRMEQAQDKATNNNRE